MPRAIRSEDDTSRYDVHPGVAMMQDWIATLKAKTGRSLEEWLRFVRSRGPKDEKSRREWLKREHKLGTNSAWWIAERASSDRTRIHDDDPESYLKAAADWVEKMYAGAKAGLRPIHDALIRLARGLGADVRVCPCQTIVPLYRAHVFAQIKPSTRTRLDLGLALGTLARRGATFPPRLIDTGGLARKDRITHRIALASVDEVDDDVRAWLRKAYDLDA